MWVQKCCREKHSSINECSKEKAELLTGTVGMGGWLDQVVLVGFSNLNL